MRTFSGLNLISFPPEQREQMKIVDDMLRMVSGGLSRSIQSGQSPSAVTVPAFTNPTGPPPSQGTPLPLSGDMLYGLPNNTWAKLPISTEGSILIVAGGYPAWLSGAGQIGWTHEWKANGPYLVDTDVDGRVLLQSPVDLVHAYAYRLTAGTGGNTTVAVKHNGGTISTLTLPYNDANNWVEASFAVPAIAGDYLSIDITGIDTGTSPTGLVVGIRGTI